MFIKADDLKKRICLLDDCDICPWDYDGKCERRKMSPKEIINIVNELNLYEIYRFETVEQIKWERDTAIEQLKSLGYSFGERPRIGHWIVLTDCANEGTYCSRCRAKIFNDTNKQHKKKLSTYCPNCGAKMEKSYEIY